MFRAIPCLRQGLCGLAERGEHLDRLLEPANQDAPAGPRDSVHSVQLYEAEHLVVTGQQTGAITLWDLRSASAVHRVVMQDPGTWLLRAHACEDLGDGGC